ncbi:MAG: cysteine hydrolase [Candidatus Tectomicrobia bacterium]|nr:cysteine hydrolase [Candidatus Tectomicrobia bacterium]
MREILTELAEIVKPEHTALLVIDMQNDFCAPGGYVQAVMGKDVSGAPRLAEIIMDLVEAARRLRIPPIWIQAIYDDHYLQPPMIAKRLPRGSEVFCCRTGTWGADFFGVKPLPGEFIVQKHRFSGFNGTPLDNLLRDHGVKTIVTTGVTTNVCVESTLRDGFFNGYYTVVPSDCVAANSPDLHASSLKNIELFFGYISTSAELQELWERG